MVEILKTTNNDHTKAKIFLDENGGVGIARYDQVKYSLFSRLLKQQKSFFWQPEEVILTRDKRDFNTLTEHEQFIFTSNLKRQIVLDSVQGRAPALAFGPIVSLPEVESWITWWTASEQVHSDSYTHIIKNIYPSASKIFDGIMDIEEVVDCAKDISKYYDGLIFWNNFLALEQPLKLNGYDFYEHKKAIWLALNAVNALEGIRFYVSFACSWAFAERKLMEGNAKIIKLICRDENLHLASTQALIKLLPKDDEDFARIQEDCADDVRTMFTDVINQEKAWADYLFKDGSMVGLNANVLKEYVDYIADSRMNSIGIKSGIKTKGNPLPWTVDWITSKNVQVTPQQTQITSYVIGGVEQDVDEDTFNGFSL